MKFQPAQSGQAKVAILSLGLGLAIFAAGGAIAQPSIIVDPEDFYFEMPRGNRDAGVLNIANAGDETLEFSVLQSRVGREGIVRIIAWTAFVDRQWDFENLRICLTNLDMDYRLQEYDGVDAAELGRLLVSSHVLLVPDQKNGDPQDLRRIGEEFSEALYDFVEVREGIVICLDSRGRTADLIRGAGLMDVRIEETGVNWDFSVRTLHPVTLEVQDYHAAAACNVHTVRENDAIVLADRVGDEAGTNISARHIGRGGVVYIGMDWFLYNADMTRLLTNAVLWSQGAASWIIIEDYIGRLDPNDSEDIIFNVHSDYTRETGHYRRMLNVRSNDPASPLLRIPVDLVVTQHQNYQIDLIPDQLFVIASAQQDTSSVLTVHNSGRGAFEANVRLEDAGQPWIEFNRNRLNIGPGSRDRILITLHGREAGDELRTNWLQLVHPITDSVLAELPIMFYAGEEFGIIEGVVLDGDNRSPLANAAVNLQGLSALTNDEGTFRLRAPPFRYRLNVSHEEYLPWQALASIDRDDTTRLVIELDYCTLDSDLSEVYSISLEPDTTIAEPGTFTNAGSGNLNFTVQFLDDNPPLPLRPWEQRWEDAIGRRMELTQVGGVAFDGERLFFSAALGLDKFILICSTDGEVLDSFPQPAGHPLGMADLAWDGRLLWATGRRELLGFNTEGEIIERIPTPLNYNRAVAYDRIRDLFWVADIGSDIYAVNRNGQHRGWVSNRDLRIYGLAVHPDDAGGDWLYVASRTGADNAQIYSVNPDSGETNLLLEMPADADEAIAGIEITSQWDYRHWTILTQLSGGSSHLAVYNLTHMADWANISPSQGTIEPDQSLDVSLIVNSHGFDVGDELSGRLIISGQQRGGQDTINVSLSIVPSAVGDGGSYREPLPEQFTLSAFPNPFNASLAVSINGVRFGQKVTLDLYDLTGRKVVRDVVIASKGGTARVVMNAGDLPSALYLLRATAGEQVKSVRVVLMK